MNKVGVGFLYIFLFISDLLNEVLNKSKLLDFIEIVKWYNDFGEVY